MVEFDRFQNSEKHAASRLKITVVGIGGGGLNVLDRISLDRMMDASLLAMDTDIRDLNHSMAPSKIQLGSSLILGIGSGGDPELGAEAASSTANEIRGSLHGSDIVFICGGLGGGTCSGAAPVVAEIAKKQGAMVFVFASMPFSFQGRRTVLQAEEARKKLQSSADALILFENSRMGELVLPKEGIQKAFSQADQLIGHSIRAISSIVNQRGLIGMNIADVMAALRNPDARCLFGYGEARGQNRVQEVLKRAMKSPLINEGDLLTNSKNLLVHIAGGENFTLDEVQALMNDLGKRVPDSTRIMFGLSSDPKLGDSVCLTLLSSLTAEEVIPPSLVEAESELVQPSEPAPTSVEPLSSQSHQASQIETALPQVTAPQSVSPEVGSDSIPTPLVVEIQALKEELPSVTSTNEVDSPVLKSPVEEVKAPSTEMASHNEVQSQFTTISSLVSQELIETAESVVQAPTPEQPKVEAVVSEVVPPVISAPVVSAPEAAEPAPEIHPASQGTSSLFKLVENLVESPAVTAEVKEQPVASFSAKTESTAVSSELRADWYDKYIDSKKPQQTPVVQAQTPSAFTIAETPKPQTQEVPQQQAKVGLPSQIKLEPAPQAKVEAPVTSNPAVVTTQVAASSMFTIAAAPGKESGSLLQATRTSKSTTIETSSGSDASVDSQDNLDVPTWLRLRNKK